MPDSLVARLEGDMWRLSGRIDEYVDYEPIGRGRGVIKLDMSGIRAINSVGMRDFIAFVWKHQARGIEMHKCSPAVVEMINTLPQTLGNPPDPKMVRSLYVTYRCDTCRKEELALATMPRPAADGTVSLPLLPARVCSACGKVSKVDSPSDEYFAFATDVT